MVISEESLLEEKPIELAQPSEAQGGAISEEAQLAHIDVFLNRLFQVGEILPWKKCQLQVIGIRGGVIGLTLKSISTPPKARANHGRSPSRGARKPHQPKPEKNIRPWKDDIKPHGTGGIGAAGRMYKHPVIQDPIETEKE